MAEPYHEDCRIIRDPVERCLLWRDRHTCRLIRGCPGVFPVRPILRWPGVQSWVIRGRPDCEVCPVSVTRTVYGPGLPIRATYPGHGGEWHPVMLYPTWVDTPAKPPFTRQEIFSGSPRARRRFWFPNGYQYFYVWPSLSLLAEPPTVCYLLYQPGSPPTPGTIHIWARWSGGYPAMYCEWDWTHVFDYQMHCCVPPPSPWGQCEARLSQDVQYKPPLGLTRDWEQGGNPPPGSTPCDPEYADPPPAPDPPLPPPEPGEPPPEPWVTPGQAMRMNVSAFDAIGLGFRLTIYADPPPQQLQNPHLYIMQWLQDHEWTSEVGGAVYREFRGLTGQARSYHRMLGWGGELRLDAAQSRLYHESTMLVGDVYAGEAPLRHPIICLNESMTPNQDLRQEETWRTVEFYFTGPDGP